MKRILFCVLVVFALGANSFAAGAKEMSIRVSAHFYRLASALDVDSIKAIGSAQTRRAPSVLQVSKAEAARIVALATKAGGSLLGSPSAITPLDKNVKISTTQDDGGGCSLDVTPTTKSDTISMTFKLAATSVQGNRKTTRSASGSARVVETRSLLLIENPRDGQPGLLIVLEAVRQK